MEIINIDKWWKLVTVLGIALMAAALFLYVDEVVNRKHLSA